MAKLKDLLGKRFGRLEVIARAPNLRTPNRTHRTMWLCRCDCGKEVQVVASNLTRKDRDGTQSCGCLRLEAVASKDWLGVEFRRYRTHSNSRRRGREIPFRLTVKEFGSLVSQDCFYCGRKPSTRTHTGGRMRNGIDRVDNSKGYEKGNVVPCCGTCNKIKGSLKVKEFLEKAKEIVSHQRL